MHKLSDIFVIFRHGSQKSIPIRLIRRRVYYMEALMKEGGGGDHISVAMRMRGRIIPIPSRYLYLIPPGKIMKWIKTIISSNYEEEKIFLVKIIVFLMMTKIFFSSPDSTTKIW